jgi:hypothetical protein
MNINMIITTLTILAHLVHIDYRSVHEVAVLLEEVVDTSYFISFSFPIPSVPPTIDPSPPVLAPPFDPINTPTAAHTHSRATSTDPTVANRSLDFAVCLVLVIVTGILLCVSPPRHVHSPFGLS